MLKRLLCVGIIVWLSTGAPSANADREVGNIPRAEKASSISQATELQHRTLRRLRLETWHWQNVMHRQITQTLPGIRTSLASVRTERERYSLLIRRWRRLRDLVVAASHHPPYRAQLLCIYSYEKNRDRSRGPVGWQSNSGNDYYGGLQMDISFQRTYSPYLYRQKGTADRWSPLEQIWTAGFAVPSRGFSPWPRTARACGLL